MKSFKKFLNVALISLAMFGLVGVASAQDVPFYQPHVTQTGSYSVANVDLFTGDVTVFPRTGALLEVIPGGSTVIGTTIPDNTVILWGSFTFPEIHLNFQTDVLPVVPFNQTYAVTVFTSTFTSATGLPQVTVMGQGFFIFDPLNVGDGKTVDLLLNVTTPYIAYRELVPSNTQVRYRFTRYVTSAVVQACDRSGVVDFSPAPPITQCD